MYTIQQNNNYQNNLQDRIIIRRATPNDTEDITKAITSAGGSFLPWLFGKNFYNIVHESTNSDNCSFSWINAIVAEINNKIVRKLFKQLKD